ncbi:MAG TPA: dTDP-4-dehydrorhamnose 3,5-epimerase [Candidatus Baltobacteraceae bacterium]|jgi:dTDP-4-dehydrorhamnose 3,5-epimerase|nr:dTDP-4-dehydrorhamnose 3,5-epimerase [Candidatus Baltobacteraceae bacterium]
MLKAHKTKFADVLLLEPDVFPDDRGFFKEVFSAEKYAAIGIRGPFVQDNVSYSRRGVLRGMHYDLRMAKLVQCVQGAIFDVVVDMRDGSPTYKHWDGIDLTSENHRQLYVPPGFAHGFYVRSDAALVLYKQTAAYDPSQERAISWRDPTVGIAWPLDGEPVLSAKDAAL